MKELMIEDSRMLIPVAPCGVWTAKLPGADVLGASTPSYFHIYGRKALVRA